MDKPFSPAADRNKQYILEKLQAVIGECKTVLEIGSGTAQHALHFATALPNVIWQPSNLPAIIEQTRAGLEGSNLDNMLEPMSLDVSHKDWLDSTYDLVYTANTCHIMAWEHVLLMFESVAKVLKESGLFCVYGPFNYGSKFTSKGNREFDAKLRASKAWQGIRDFESVVALAKEHSLKFIKLSKYSTCT